MSAGFPEPRAFQRAAHNDLRAGLAAGHKRQILAAPTGSGKCLARGTPVMLADGRAIPVENVREGDLLMGPDGQPRTVLGVATGREMMYRVTPTKGDPYTVNASHILSLRKTPRSDGIVLSDGSRIARDADIVNVNVEVYARSNATTRRCLKGWRADAIEAFHRDDSPLPLPPYILGVWLGDGTQGVPAITKPMCNMAVEWIAYAASIGYLVRDECADRCPKWRITHGQRGKPNAVSDALESLGVMRERFIPDEYKFGNAEVRRQILAGLIDSDGHITNAGCDWISASERMAQDFAFVCRSLGLACYISKQRKSIKASGFDGWYWRASVSGDLSAIPMRDKAARRREQKKRHLVHGLSVAPVGVDDYFGFEIDGDRLFLLGDFTVTHNTYMAMRLISEALAKGRRALFVADRITLIDQTSNTASEYGLDNHGVIQAAHWRRFPHRPLQIASCQTLARRQWPIADVIVVDECFVAGTIVDGPSGETPIELVRPGHKVYNAIGLGVVESVFSSEKTTIAKVRLTDGTEIRCTPDHPFFTAEGWVPAEKLVYGQMAYRKEDLSELWGGVWPESGGCWKKEREAGGGALFRQEDFLREVLRKEIQKPNAQFRDKKEGVEIFEGNWAPSDCARREWSPDEGSASCIIGDSWRRVDSGVLRSDGIEGCERVSARIQDRHCEPATEDRIGNRRRLPLLFGAQGSRRKERRSVAQVRVESVEMVELESPVRVFNLRVSGHPSYFVGGVLVHNCHTQYSSWTEHVSDCDVPVIGLTATPFSKGLGKIFSNVVNAETMKNLTEQGLLKRLRVVTAHRPDMSDVPKVAGEWTAEGAGEAALTIAGDAVKEWQDRAADRKTIMFCPDIKTCEEMQTKFRDAGVLAETFTERTKPEQREKILTEYRKRDSAIRILISVEALAKGFDVPDVSCVIDMRPLRKSFSSWVQMIGRGLRKSPGLEDCLLMDHSGNAVRFGPDFEELYHHGVQSLDKGEKLDAAIRELDESVERGCPACGAVPFVRQCMCCGYVTPPKPSVEVMPANMIELDLVGTGDKRALYVEVASYVKASPYYAGDEAGRKKAAAIFKSLTGAWPPWKWNDDLWPLVGVGQCSAKTAGKIRQNMIAYARRQAA